MMKVAGLVLSRSTKLGTEGGFTFPVTSQGMSALSSEGGGRSRREWK
jgi:hypothetical protein